MRHCLSSILQLCVNRIPIIATAARLIIVAIHGCSCNSSSMVNFLDKFPLFCFGVSEFGHQWYHILYRHPVSGETVNWQSAIVMNSSPEPIIYWVHLQLVGMTTLEARDRSLLLWEKYVVIEHENAIIISLFVIIYSLILRNTWIFLYFSLHYKVYHFRSIVLIPVFFITIV